MAKAVEKQREEEKMEEKVEKHLEKHLEKMARTEIVIVKESGDFFLLWCCLCWWFCCFLLEAWVFFWKMPVVSVQTHRRTKGKEHLSRSVQARILLCEWLWMHHLIGFLVDFTATYVMSF